MRNRLFYTLCTLTLISGFSTMSLRADDIIVSDIASDPELIAEIQTDAAEHSYDTPDSEADTAAGSNAKDAADHADAETESESPIALIETEAVYEVPLGISDGLEMNTPVGQAAEMSEDERKEFINEMCEANSAESFRGRHEDVTAAFSLYDEDSSDWKQYSCSYTDYILYYSDDWSPGMEELRILIYGENDCMEHYMGSMGFIHLLNASGVPYRVPGKTPIVLADDTKEESLLSLHKTSDALYVITQMTESELPTLGIYEDADSEAGSPLFYTSLYVLDPQTLEVYMMRITRHNADGSNQDVRNITYSYDCGMSEFIKTGYIELLRHMMPSVAWGPDYVRTVKVTLDPGTENERTYLTEALQGDAVSISLPDGYQLYSDEALTQPWIDDGNYLSDLTLWAG